MSELLLTLEEYKRIAPLLTTPSLATVLFSSSAVFWHNWILFRLTGDIITAIVTALAAFASLPFIMRNRPGNHAARPVQDMPVSPQREQQTSPIRGAVFLLCIVTACMSAAVMKNHVNTGHISTPALTPPFTADIQSVRTLSYSRELILKVHYTGSSATQGSSALNAIAYAPLSSELYPGDRIVLHVKAYPLRREQFSENGSLFQHELIRKGFRATFYLNEDQYTVLSRGAPSWRSKIRTAIEIRTAALFNESTCSLLKALYFGNKNFIRTGTLTLFREVGALHILAASGTHCAIIALIPFLLLSPFRISKRIIFISSILLLAFYLYITDMPVSLQRAFIMCAVFGITFLFDFDRNPFNALFIAATILIVMHPYEPYSVGFQLTFGATFGILAWYRMFRDQLKELPKILRNPIALTLSAQVLVFPIIFFHFGEINIASLLSNLIIVPGIQAILVGSILLTALSAVLPWDISVVALSVDLAYRTIIGAAGAISQLHLHFSYIETGTALIAPYILYLSPLVPFKKLRPVQLPFLCVSFFLATGILILSAGPVDTCGILMTGNSIIASVNVHEQPVLYGKLGSRDDTETLVRYIARRHIKNIALYITEADFKNMRHYTRLIKNAGVTACHLPEDFQYGKHMSAFLAAAEQNGIPISFFNPRTTAPPPGSNPLSSPAENCRKIYLSITGSARLRMQEKYAKCGAIR
jgi:ComEC/Rec2-related protein